MACGAQEARPAHADDLRVAPAGADDVGEVLSVGDCHRPVGAPLAGASGSSRRRTSSLLRSFPNARQPRSVRMRTLLHPSIALATKTSIAGERPTTLFGCTDG